MLPCKIWYISRCCLGHTWRNEYRKWGKWSLKSMFEGWLFGVVFPWIEDHQHLVSVRKVDNGLWAVFVLWFGCFEFCGKKRLLDHILKDCYIMFPNFSAGPIWLSCNKNQKGSNSDGKKYSWTTKQQMTHWSSSVCLDHWSCAKARADKPWAASEGVHLPITTLREQVDATGYTAVQSYHKLKQQQFPALLERANLLFWAVCALPDCSLGWGLTLRGLHNLPSKTWRTSVKCSLDLHRSIVVDC